MLWQIVTMPPWNKGPAEVELINPIQTPNVTNITRVVPIITSSTDYLTISKSTVGSLHDNCGFITTTIHLYWFI